MAGILKVKRHIMATNLFEAEVVGLVDAVEVEELIDLAVLHEVGERVFEQESEKKAVARVDETSGAGLGREVLRKTNGCLNRFHLTEVTYKSLLSWSLFQAHVNENCYTST